MSQEDQYPSVVEEMSGTPVMQEVLSKLFHERMDIIGATVLRGIQSTANGLEVTANGPLDFKQVRRFVS